MGDDEGEEGGDGVFFGGDVEGCEAEGGFVVFVFLLVVVALAFGVHLIFVLQVMCFPDFLGTDRL